MSAPRICSQVRRRSSRVTSSLPSPRVPSCFACCASQATGPRAHSLARSAPPKPAAAPADTSHQVPAPPAPSPLPPPAAATPAATAAEECTNRALREMRAARCSHGAEGGADSDAHAPAAAPAAPGQGEPRSSSTPDRSTACESLRLQRHAMSTRSCRAGAPTGGGVGRRFGAPCVGAGAPSCAS
eukprot:364500-Chlamydomonas_euryale.AAC.37